MRKKMLWISVFHFIGNILKVLIYFEGDLLLINLKKIISIL